MFHKQDNHDTTFSTFIAKYELKFPSKYIRLERYWVTRSQYFNLIIRLVNTGGSEYPIGQFSVEKCYEPHGLREVDCSWIQYNSATKELHGFVPADQDSISIKIRYDSTFY